MEDGTQRHKTGGLGAQAVLSAAGTAANRKTENK